jgi:GTP-binding protein EngB required for normal cell division
MREYIANRKSLRVLFHLVDARHGLVDEDTTIMKQVSESLRPGVSYVVVLTKADKNVNGASSKNLGKVSHDILNKLRETMVACGVGDAPVVLTSAETKLGRDGIWRHLRRAAEF